MTVTNEQIQALREKFEAAVMERICISKSTLIGLRTDEGYRNSTLSGNDYQADWEYFLAGYSCSLAERDADKALIAESVVLFETLRQRIAELEALLKAAENNEIDARCHIAELQDRTLKFPPAVPVANWMAGIDVYDADLVKELLFAAGITLVVGE